MKYLLIAAISSVILLFTFGCEKTKENESYLSKWLGTYEGTSHQWSSYPSSDPPYHEIENNDYGNVQVVVQKSIKDSCLNLLITFNDSIHDEMNDMQFSVSGIHRSEWGAGSSYGSLDIRFDADVLHFSSFQKCGIPCSGGTDFVISRQ